MKPIRLLARASVLLAVASPCAFAQSQTRGGGRVVITSASIELNFDQIVQDAPFTAEGTTTTNVARSDGSHADTTTTRKVFRDGQGRERREQTIIGVSMFAVAGQPMQPVVTITDPVGKVSYTLDALTRTARRMPMTDRTTEDRRVIIMRASPSQIIASPGPGGVALPRTNPAAGAMTAMTAAGVVPGGATRVVVEMLGSKSIDGEMATGRRTVSTLADGTDVIDEQWTSTDLKVTVKSKHHDPRTGDVLYKLTNIVRGEPDASLFAVPHDYTIVDDVVALPRTPGQ